MRWSEVTGGVAQIGVFVACHHGNLKCLSWSNLRDSRVGAKSKE